MSRTYIKWSAGQSLKVTSALLCGVRKRLKKFFGERDEFLVIHGGVRRSTHGGRRYGIGGSKRFAGARQQTASHGFVDCQNRMVHTLQSNWAIWHCIKKSNARPLPARGDRLSGVPAMLVVAVV